MAIAMNAPIVDIHYQLGCWIRIQKGVEGQFPCPRGSSVLAAAA